MRKDPLVNDNYYHVFNRSIAQFNIFNDEQDYFRFIELIELYRYKNFSYKYSDFLDLKPEFRANYLLELKLSSEMMVEILAYCIMPTHIHLILKQKVENGISKYISNVLNSYTKYFNFKHHRNGPLWSGRFVNVLVDNDEQLLHLTRYIHLNPSSAGLIENPVLWMYSSVSEYLDPEVEGICNFINIINLQPSEYRDFILDRKAYQAELSIIKAKIIDDYYT